MRGCETQTANTWSDCAINVVSISVGMAGGGDCSRMTILDLGSACFVLVGIDSDEITDETRRESRPVALGKQGPRGANEAVLEGQTSQPERRSRYQQPNRSIPVWGINKGSPWFLLSPPFSSRLLGLPRVPRPSVPTASFREIADESPFAHALHTSLSSLESDPTPGSVDGPQIPMQSAPKKSPVGGRGNPWSSRTPQRASYLHS